MDDQRPALPPPHATVHGKLGTHCSFESAVMRKGDAVYTADQMRAALESRRGKDVPDEWTHNMLLSAVRAIEAGNRAALLMNVEALKDNLRNLARTFGSR